MDARMPPIGDVEAVDVPDIAYYRRRIADGSLVRVPAVETDIVGADSVRPPDKSNTKKEKA
jgi:hypothetical protein